MLVDVTNPVVINATTAVLRESPSHLRRVCLISLGSTTLNEGEFREVFKYDYLNYVKKYSEMLTKCRAFFSQASNKGLTILELGKQSGQPIPDNYNNLVNYSLQHSEFSLNKFYEWLYKVKWDLNDERENQETGDLLIAFYNNYQPGTPFDEENYKQWCQVNSSDETNIKSYKGYFDAVLPSTWTEAYYDYLSRNNDSFKAIITLDNLKEYLGQLTDSFYSPEDYLIYREENGTKEVDYELKFEKLNQFITNSENPCYVFLLPDGMGNDSTIGEKLLTQYNDLLSNQYFFINYTNDNLETYSTSEIFANVKGCKCAALFVNNTEDSDLAALTAGLFASYKFDLSETNPASPFNYKAIEGVKYKTLPQPLRQQMIQDSVNYLDRVATSVVLLNGRYGDTYPIDYRYQWDLVSFQVATDLKQIILNGVNNPMYVIKYNQDGIDVIKSRVKSSLNKMISLGAVTEFAASMNPATDELISIGDISCIDFRPYIEANPEDYQNEVYAGISFYLRIGRYIRQVVLNVTLG